MLCIICDVRYVTCGIFHLNEARKDDLWDVSGKKFVKHTLTFIEQPILFMLTKSTSVPNS